MEIAAILGTIGGFILVTLGLIFFFVNKWVKNDYDVQKLKLQKETMELQVKLLEEENKKYDRIINENAQEKKEISTN